MQGTREKRPPRCCPHYHPRVTLLQWSFASPLVDFHHHEFGFNGMLADGNLGSGGFDVMCCGAAEAGR